MTMAFTTISITANSARMVNFTKRLHMIALMYVALPFLYARLARSMGQILSAINALLILLLIHLVTVFVILDMF